MSRRSIPRRDFVKTATAAAAFTIVPRKVLGRGFRAPSDMLNVACVGVGGMGWRDVRGVADAGGQIVALCDVDWVSAADAFKAHPDARRYRDFREMFAMEEDVDAVTVTIPDHGHAVVTLAALSGGKHCYTQKPLVRTLGESRRVREAAAARPNLITQMGNQGHAGDGVRTLREWVEADLIGTVREVHMWTDRPIWPQGINRPTEMHVPRSTFDWDLWLGPAQHRQYHPAYAPFRWRGWWDFGTGALGDMACHIMDAAYWILDLGYPYRVEAETSKLYRETAPKASRVTFYFPAKNGRPEVKVVWRDGALVPPRPRDWPDTESWPPWNDGGQLWVGDGGRLVAGTYGEDPRLLDRSLNEEVTANPLEQRYPRVESVYHEWLDGIRSGTQAGSSFSGHASGLTDMVLLGVVAQRMGSALEVNSNTGEIVSDVPREFIEPEYREGW